MLKEKATISSGNILSHFQNRTPQIVNKVAAAELGLVYHNVKHHHSYASLDCGNKLCGDIFGDFEVAQKMSCGRTKGECMVKNVLATKSVEDFLQVLRDPMKTSLFFSIATDASNKVNRKIFPVCIQYFDPCKGIEHKLLNFIEQAEESADCIYKLLSENLKSHSLYIKNVSAYSADNANVNFGKRHSVYELLKADNSNIIKANCSNHVLHNAIKYAIDRLDIDVENIVLKVYNHFSVSAKRREELKNFFEFVHLEWSEIIRHAPTRWLSLGPAI